MSHEGEDEVVQPEETEEIEEGDVVPPEETESFHGADDPPDVWVVEEREGREGED